MSDELPKRTRTRARNGTGKWKRKRAPSAASHTTTTDWDGIEVYKNKRGRSVVSHATAIDWDEIDVEQLTNDLYGSDEEVPVDETDLSRIDELVPLPTEEETGIDPQLFKFMQSFESEKNEYSVLALNCNGVRLQKTTRIEISNNVVQVRLNVPIDWHFVIPRCMRYGMKFSPKNFGAIDMACLEPKVTMRVYSSGRINCSGARTIIEAISCIQRMIEILRSLRDNFNIAIYRSLRCTGVKLVNVVGDIDAGFQIDLCRLAENAFVFYDPNLWPTANIPLNELDPVRYAGRRVVALISGDGKIVFSGAHSRADLVQNYQDLLPILVNCAVQAELASMRTTDQERRSEVKRLRFERMAPDSHAFIKINHILPLDDELKLPPPPPTTTLALIGAKGTGTSLVPTSAVALKRKGIPSGNEMALNLIALESMEQRRADSARKLAEQLDAEVDVSGRAVLDRINLLSPSEAALLAMMHD